MFVPNTTSRPPADMVMPQTAQLWFTIATQIPFIVYFGFSLKNVMARGDPTALFFGIGGCIAGLFEPVVDVLGFCYFPRAGNWIAYEFLGRPIPVFVPATYGWFVGGMGYGVYAFLQDAPSKTPATRADFRSLWFKAFLVNLVLEYPPLYVGIYTYYGYQPLQVAGFPLWFPAVNATTPLVAGTIVNLIGPHLKGMQKLVIVTTAASAYGLANAAFGFPVWLALSTDKGYGATYPAVACTALLLACGVWIMSLQIPERGEVRLNGHSGKQRGSR